MVNRKKQCFDYMTSSPDRYNILKEFARENLMKMTDGETILWETLRDFPKPFHFRRQHIIGDFIVDFVCFERQLVIEVDGGYHSEPHQQEEDLSRTESLGRMGFDVIRFTNEQVIENQQEVIREIKEILYNE